MELTLLEQAAALLQTSRTPVIILPQAPSSDALAGGLGLLLILERLGKKARVVSPEFSLPAGHDFLPKSTAVEQRLSALRSFIITVDLSRTKLDSLSYAVDGNKLNIFLSPRGGFYEASDVTTSSGNYAFDAIITIDLPSPEALGPLYHENTEFFYHTPTLNIDHHASNTRYGHVNLVDVVASSASEIIFELVKILGFEHLDEQVATSLLTGIISKTKAFQADAVTPRSLAVASHLMSAGARRDDIIKHLYQTKSLAGLKLWGRALTKLKTTPDGSVVWSNITSRDFQETKATAEEAMGVLDELMINTPDAKITCLFVEAADGTQVHINTKQQRPPQLPSDIVQRSSHYFSGTVRQPLTTAEAQILATLGA
ncbi:MAG: hypothetical protein HY975_00175 [Candidatus Kerfeldbacteria bacterium]|nr:hypothetical protein [Candidatus Kerfeldbacteria bacterium]